MFSDWSNIIQSAKQAANQKAAYITAVLELFESNEVIGLITRRSRILQLEAYYMAMQAVNVCNLIGR